MDFITLRNEKLGKKVCEALNKRFFEARTQMEVAEEIHISQAQVSRLEKSALESIKDYLAQ